MSIKEIVVGGAITLFIGGTAYTVNQADVVDNFASDTGLTQQQAEEYVNNVTEDDLVPYDELGRTYVNHGSELVASATQIDCINYEYDWQSPTLSCEKGRSQLLKLGNDEIALGNSYTTLSTQTASALDINNTIDLLTEVNYDYSFEVVTKLIDFSSIDEAKKTNSYNKALLEAAIESAE